MGGVMCVSETPEAAETALEELLTHYLVTPFHWGWCNSEGEPLKFGLNKALSQLAPTSVGGTLRLFQAMHSGYDDVKVTGELGVYAQAEATVGHASSRLWSSDKQNPHLVRNSAWVNFGGAHLIQHDLPEYCGHNTVAAVIVNSGPGCQGLMLLKQSSNDDKDFKLVWLGTMPTRIRKSGDGNMIIGSTEGDIHVSGVVMLIELEPTEELLIDVICGHLATPLRALATRTSCGPWQVIPAPRVKDGWLHVLKTLSAGRIGYKHEPKNLHAFHTQSTCARELDDKTAKASSGNHKDWKVIMAMWETAIQTSDDDMDNYSE